MEQSEKICKWITDKVNKGRGAVVFSLEENDGLVGVWIEPIREHEGALGYGGDVFEAVLDAMNRDAEHRRASDHAEQKCPTCKGFRHVAGEGVVSMCLDCNGTGISNRSAGS